MFFTNSMSSFGARAPCSSSFFVSSCSQCTSSSAESVVGSTVWSRPRSWNTASRSASGGNAPRSRSAPQLAHRVAARRADEQHQERHALRLVEAAGDAEVHEHGAAVGLHHQVAAVQVAVEDAVQHRAFHERDEPGVQHRLGVDAGVVHRGDVVPRDAASRSITSTRRVTSVRVRARARAARADRSRASTRAMSSMFSASSRKSSSSTIVSANSSTSAGGLASAAIGMRPVSRGASHAIASRSWRTSSRDLRPLHLDDDFFAGAQPRRVHLRDRRGRDRRPVEADEHVVERAAELHLDDPPDRVERLGRHAVAQQLELGDELGREQPLAARDDLAELDVGRSELPEGDAQPARRCRACSPRPLRAVRGQPTAASGVADPADDLGQPAERRQVPGLEPARHLGLRLGAQAVDVGAATAWPPGSTTQGPSSVKPPIARSGEAIPAG